ncbi:MAG: hypothetical protein KA436_00525 [Oligoflexales bacterium]|nr:hypothetical protein [Oligoflexales bacterium]
MKTTPRGRLPLIFSLVFSLLAILSLPVNQYLDETWLGLEKSKEAFSFALHSTRMTLSSHIDNLAMDTSVLSPIELGLPNSMQKNMLGRIKYGQIDQILLLDEQCEPLSKAHYKKVPNPSCPIQEGFQWGQTGIPDQLFLSFSKKMKLAENKNFWLTGQVLLDHDWVQTYPFLKEALSLSELHVVAVAENSVDLGRRFFFVEGSGSASIRPALFSESHVYKEVLKEKIQVFKTPLGNFVTLLFCLLASMFILVAIRRSQQEERLAAQIPKDEPNFAPYKGLSADTSSESSERNPLSSKLKEQEFLLHDMKARIKTFEDLFNEPSLGISLKNSVEKHILLLMEKLQSLEHGLEDIRVCLDSGLEEKTGEILSFLRNWKEGIDQFGARKFIRTLYETPSRQHVSLTELDEQILYLSSHLESLLSFFSIIKIEFSKLSEQSKWPYSLFSNWYGFTVVDQDQMESSSFEHVTQKAQEILQLELEYVPFKLRVETVGNLVLPIPPNPSLWVAVFFKLFQAIRAQNSLRDKSLTLVFKQRERDELQMLTLSIVDERGLVNFQRDEKYLRQIREASRLLEAFGIRVTQLPTVEGSYAIAISWKKSKDLSPSLLQGGSLGEAAQPVHPETIL